MFLSALFSENIVARIMFPNQIDDDLFLPSIDLGDEVFILPGFLVDFSYLPNILLEKSSGEFCGLYRYAEHLLMGDCIRPASTQQLAQPSHVLWADPEAHFDRVVLVLLADNFCNLMQFGDGTVI